MGGGALSASQALYAEVSWVPWTQHFEMSPAKKFIFVDPCAWKLLSGGLIHWGLTVIVISCLFIGVLPMGNIKCPVRLETMEEDSLGIQHRSRCYHLTAKSCSYAHSASCFAGLQHGLVLWDSVTPCFSGSCTFLDSSSLTAELFALESLSQKTGIGEHVKGNRSAAVGLRGVRIFFSMEIRKEKCLCNGVGS